MFVGSGVRLALDRYGSKGDLGDLLTVVRPNLMRGHCRREVG
jgi:hypothetical protein